MELGILTDDRNNPEATVFTPELTPLGEELFEALRPVLQKFDLSFPRGADGIPSSRMLANEDTYNAAIRSHIESDDTALQVVLRVFLRMPAVQQMLAFLYQIARAKEIARQTVYDQFFQTPFVRQFCDQEGIEEATLEASKRRCPFLLNVLEACGIVDAQRDLITVNKLMLVPALVRPYQREDLKLSLARLEAFAAAWPTSPELLSSEDLSILKELFGSTLLTADYYLDQLEITTYE